MITAYLNKDLITESSATTTQTDNVYSLAEYRAKYPCDLMIIFIVTVALIIIHILERSNND